MTQGNQKDHPVSKILPSLLPGVQNLLTIDLAEMQMLWVKGTQKFELTKRYTMPDTQSFFENEGGRLEGCNLGRRKGILTEFIILLKLTLNQRKTRFPGGGGKGEGGGGLSMKP